MNYATEQRIIDIGDSYQIDFKEYSCFNFSDLICNIPANLLKLKYKTNSINENRKTVLENIDRSIGLDTILKLNANSKFSLLCILLNSGVLEEFKTPQLYKRKILLIDQCNHPLIHPLLQMQYLLLVIF
jgi:hypothetical protein